MSRIGGGGGGGQRLANSHFNRKVGGLNPIPVIQKRKDEIDFVKHLKQLKNWDHS